MQSEEAGFWKGSMLTVRQQSQSEQHQLKLLQTRADWLVFSWIMEVQIMRSHQP